jgi:hypothetical protein
MNFYQIFAQACVEGVCGLGPIGFEAGFFGDWLG